MRMSPESLEAKLARLEESVRAIREDTTYLREGFDEFRKQYWQQLVKEAGKMGSLAAIVSFLVAAATALASHLIEH